MQNSRYKLLKQAQNQYLCIVRMIRRIYISLVLAITAITTALICQTNHVTDIHENEDSVDNLTISSIIVADDAPEGQVIFDILQEQDSQASASARIHKTRHISGADITKSICRTFSKMCFTINSHSHRATTTRSNEPHYIYQRNLRI